MVRYSFRFPHISRFFPERVFLTLLWAGFGLLIAINSLQTPPNLPERKEDTSVLGVSESESAELQSRFAYWKSIAEEKPDYRDAFLMAAAAAYQLENYEEARTLTNRAFALDPASTTVGELRTILED